MARPKIKILLAFSGGKDSVMALHELRRDDHFEVVGLICGICETSERVTLHGTSMDLLQALADHIGLPLFRVSLPQDCDGRTGSERLAAMVRDGELPDVRTIAFGDIFLDDVRDQREETLAAAGLDAVFPLWQRDTTDLALDFIALKYQAVVTSVDERLVPRSFLGRIFDRSLLADLPLGVDPCGENGEFRTFVFNGPRFANPIPLKPGAVTMADSRSYFDVILRHGVAAGPTRHRSRRRS